MAKEFKLHGQLQYELEPFAPAEDHHLVRFRSPEDCKKVLDGGPWFVAGQLMTVEPWVSDFVPRVNVVRWTIIWVQISGLPMEYQDKEVLMEIAGEAGKPIGLDEFTDHHRKIEFARAQVEVDATEPLKPGISIRGIAGLFRQPFVYEKITIVCYRCSRVDHSNDECRFSPEEKLCLGHELQPENVLGGSTTVELAEEMAVETEQQPRMIRPRMGPWVATSRIR
ncbi:hypothetical protein COCNU_11G012140 [Cocos nucifera]|uniref:DUF4283 domain-containing protein n=1 Tax=Cocos nucifera TaxID=13894 RepID=A0A8K0NA13_COCNU|nr:hypothetical protein COCNU_11G012140 [Cocos nucifera]